MSRAYFSFLGSVNFALCSSPRLGIDAPIATVTPLVLDEFTRELAAYPSSKQRYVLGGIRLGFHVGLEPHRVSLRSRSSNMRSALDHAEVVDEYLIVVAAHLWGRAWFRLRVQFLCDNMAVVSVLNSGTSESADLMHLLRLLTLEACRHNFVFSADHTPGRDNSAADALSVCTYRSSDAWLLTPIRSPVKFRHHCSRSWYLLLDPPVFWSQGLAPSTRRVYAAG